MERIQQALNKAEEQRRKLAGSVQADASPSRAEEVNSECCSHDAITYSSTKTLTVSTNTMLENRLVAGIKDHPQADVFKVLRTKIRHKMEQANINTLAVTSPGEKSGKSLVAANLAVSLSLEVNHTVLLVDMDLRRPSIHKYFGFEPEHGLADHLAGNMEISSLLVHPGIERLVLLPSGNQIQHSSELISTPMMADLMEDITNRYTSRIIIFDLPPLLHIDDALIFLPKVQSSLLVVEAGVNTPTEVKESLQLLENSNLLGTVYNKARQYKNSSY
ncbi:MAG: polysaccharide biosynthesis tyrosine autokinase [Gammaproteobacteria bacterium]|nr:polysaccharide biosynthesis tyrosine autokinase [Gammaproteobacteria bacterium]